jgi:hypothetical protein
MEVRKKKQSTKMYPEELRAYYEQVKRSGKVSEVDTKYKRSRERAQLRKLKKGQYE